MTRVVVDTNVLASAALRVREDSSVVRVIDLWLDRKFELVISSHIRREIATTLHSPYFVARISVETREAFLADLDTLAVRVTLIRTVSQVATHVEDDFILATALNANADYLVTGDKALLELGTFEGTRIVSAADFVAIIEAS